ncbi:MAG: hypothetical protein JXA66_00385 [Oligoflexia bacterium]|nr:hypothetical protein [Oligoflexia bacterium]
MAVIVINNTRYAANDSTIIEGVIPLHNSFILKDGDYCFGYAVCNETIIPVLGENTEFINSALGLSYKGRRFALLFDDIEYEGESELLLEDFIDKIFESEKQE